MVNRLTKYVYFILFYKTDIAQQLAEVFVERVFFYYTFPNNIVSDCDKLFLSHFWQTAIELLNIKIKLLIFYYPQTDGQMEQTNQTMEQYLRVFMNYK